MKWIGQNGKKGFRYCYKLKYSPEVSHYKNNNKKSHYVVNHAEGGGRKPKRINILLMFPINNVKKKGGGEKYDITKILYNEEFIYISHLRST